MSASLIGSPSAPYQRPYSGLHTGGTETPHSYESGDDDETTPLTGQREGVHTKRRVRDDAILYSTGFIALVFIVLFICQNAGALSTLVDDVPASEKAARRQEWKRQTAAHERDVVRWDHERADHRREQDLWALEREERERDRAAWKDAVEAERTEWWRRENIDREEWKKAVEAERVEWWSREKIERGEWKEAVEAEREKWWCRENASRDEWLRERDVERREWQEKWDTEREELEREREQERQEWDVERAKWAVEREEEERHRKEMERRRQGVRWSEAQKDRGCHASGVQAYSASLLDIPGGLDWREICMDFPIKIGDRWFDHPDKCEGDQQNARATWYVPGQAQCTTFWDHVAYTGCTGQKGLARYKSRLLNLHHGDNWDDMCHTTPAIIEDIRYEHPTACIDDGGRTGVWDIYKAGCP